MIHLLDDGYNIQLRYDFLTALLLKIQVLQDMMLCCWMSSSRHFKGSCTHLQGLFTLQSL